MKTTLEIEPEKPSVLHGVLKPSLTTDERVSYQLQTEKIELEISIETGGLGPLRGATDTAFRLSMLAEKIITR
ncbi:MAG: hypothetical protein ABEJ07_06160 [Candidatus Nanohaloarchaea archaeon]